MKPSTSLILGVCLLAACGGPREEELPDEFVGLAEEVAAVLMSVDRPEEAQAAVPRLRELGGEMVALREEVDHLDLEPDQARRLHRTLDERIAELRRRLPVSEEEMRARVSRNFRRLDTRVILELRSLLARALPNS